MAYAFYVDWLNNFIWMQLQFFVIDVNLQQISQFCGKDREKL